MSKVKQAARGTNRHGPSLWLLVPALAFFILFAFVPLVGLAVLTFFKWDGLSPLEFVGFSNWVAVFSSANTMHSLKLTLLLTVLTWLVQTPLSILLGTFMAGQQKYRAVISALYFLPLLFSSAAIGIAYKAMLDPNFGIGAASGIGFLNQNWLGSPNLAFYVVVFVIAWAFIPFHSLLYQGGVRQIPKEMYEAAQIDGAGRVTRFFRITLPQLKYTIITSSTLMIIGALTYFDLIFVMTQGGPGRATRILPLDMYLSAFTAHKMGVGATVGLVLALLGLVISLLLNRLSGASKMESQMEGF